jgi:hypothetical protein
MKISISYDSDGETDDAKAVLATISTLESNVSLTVETES